MIKYIGSKRTLIHRIVSIVQAFADVESVMDLFSGTARVGHALKGAGYRVVSNDHNAYAATIAQCYVEADLDLVGQVQLLLDQLSELPGESGYFTETFCEKSRFFQPHNGRRVDAMREAIVNMDLPPLVEAVVLVSLMEAADRVDSTTGVQMAYLKKWAPRAYNKLELRMPKLHKRPAFGACEAHQLDALAGAKTLHADLAYIDPPYNQHTYLGNYHIWESLVLWDKPAHYGVACKREDVRTRKSAFNSKPRAVQAFREMIMAVTSPRLIVSFNNEGYISRDIMESLLQEKGEVLVFESDFKRYVGAQIGIHNLKGDRVGKVSHLRNTEYLYVVAPTRRELDKVSQALN